MNIVLKIRDGSSEHGAQAWSELGNSPCNFFFYIERSFKFEIIYFLWTWFPSHVRYVCLATLLIKFVYSDFFSISVYYILLHRQRLTDVTKIAHVTNTYNEGSAKFVVLAWYGSSEHVAHVWTLFWDWKNLLWWRWCKQMYGTNQIIYFSALLQIVS